MYRKNRVLAAKIETTVGTPISLAAGDATFNVFDMDLQPTAETSARPSQGGFGQLRGYTESATGTCTFRTEMHTTGGSGVPTWASTFLPACGVVLDTSTFRLRSEMPGANVKTLTIGMYENGFFKSIRGAVGNAVFTFKPGQVVDINWTFTGAWVLHPTDVTLIAPTHSVLSLTRAEGTTTIGSFAPKYSQMTLDLGNVIAARPSIAALGGIHSYCITDRNITGTLDPESSLVGTEPTYTSWWNGVERALSIAVDDGSSSITFAAPKFQVTNAQAGDREGLMIDTLNYQLNRTVANDELTIAFAEI